LLRVGLVVFVLAWILGPYALRSAVPIWIVFAIALGLEVHFLVGALRSTPARHPDRRPQAVDRDRYGYADEIDELMVIRDGDRELWVPDTDETDEEPRPLGADVDDVDEEASATSAAVAESRHRLPAVRRFLVGLGVIGALGLTIWFVESHTGWDSLAGETRAEAAARFSAEASRIANKPVTINCDESRDYVGSVQHADGVAYVGGDRAYLTPERCYDLYRLAFEGEVTFSQTARALAVLAHEAWHLRGVRDEGTTECYALQSGAEIGQRLGLSEGTARQMMRLELTENELRGAGSLEYRVPPDCRDGGRLDLDPGSSRFP
jgi:hypothetical protein